LPYVHAMKINHKQKVLTLGEFIASVYDAHGKYKARRIVRLAPWNNLCRLTLAPWNNLCGVPRATGRVFHGASHQGAPG
jgi:hypothetical protein